MATDDKVVVTCALTGVLANRKQCPAIPYTPAEIAEEAKRAYDAGASVVHIHARNDDGSPTFDPKVFKAIKDEIRKRIRSNCSPRHVPRKIVAVADIPRTKSGKITELAVRDIIHGWPVKNKEALANPEALELYRGLAELES